jgi:hypothetical protein
MFSHSDKIELSLLQKEYDKIDINRGDSIIKEQIHFLNDQKPAINQIMGLICLIISIFFYTGSLMLVKYLN